MKGSFKNLDSCVKELHNQGFLFYTFVEGNRIFLNKLTNEVAEINIYSDSSASALIGKYTKSA